MTGSDEEWLYKSDGDDDDDDDDDDDVASLYSKNESKYI